MDSAGSRAIIDEVMQPKSGKAVELKKGQRIGITALESKQVCDVAVFNMENFRGTITSRGQFESPTSPCKAFNCMPLRVEVFEAV